MIMEVGRTMSSGIGEAPQLAKGRILSTSGRAKTILSLKEVKDAVALVVGNTQFSSPGYGQQVTSVLLLHRQLQFCGICREQFVSFVQCVQMNTSEHMNTLAAQRYLDRLNSSSATICHTSAGVASGSTKYTFLRSSSVGRLRKSSIDV
ncbi:hypothetical protein VTP01DRAFT_4098 [Rhizomucor pusillus]|uniref:uncharacterized protein n=1 Tax=Rhizomucor pusillus TaxID=4840 RepID=UPI0037444DD2